MKHAFLSYVSEDFEFVRHIADVISHNGVKVWLDKDDLEPGVFWKPALTRAIQEGSYYVPFFSKAWEARARTIANEELTIAIEELRLRPQSQTWFIPLKIDDGEVPDRQIGAGQSLRDIHYVNFPELKWQKAVSRLLKSLGVANPDLAIGEPLAPGLGSQVNIIKGEITILETHPDIPIMRGMSFSVVGGYCHRTDNNTLLAYVSTRAPNINLQNVNEQLGLASFFAVSAGREMSNDPDMPTTFFFKKQHIIPSGAPLYDLMSGKHIAFPVDIQVKNNFAGIGTIRDKSFSGTYESAMSYVAAQTQVDVVFSGSFVMEVETTYERP